MAYHYISTSQGATGITHTLKCNFTSPNDINLIVGKLNHFEIYLYQRNTNEIDRTIDPLIQQYDQYIYGRIATMKSFRLLNETTDCLLIITQRQMLFIVSYDIIYKKFNLRHHCILNDIISRSVLNDTNNYHLMKADIDPNARMIAIYLYEGYITIIPIENYENNRYINSSNMATILSKNMKPRFLDHYNIHLDILHVMEISFLTDFTKDGKYIPTLCLLYEDYQGLKKLKTMFIPPNGKSINEINNIDGQSFQKGPWHVMAVDLTSSMIISVPRPYCGMLILSSESIVYHNGYNTLKEIHPSCGYQAYAYVDDPYQRTNMAARYILSQVNGEFLILDLYIESHLTNRSIIKMKIIPIDLNPVTIIASEMAYLGSNLLFIGSVLTDSVLYSIHNTTSQDEEDVMVLELIHNFMNIGPIVDFCVMDLAREGQGQIVTCSNSNGCSSNNSIGASLRIIRNGIGLNDIGNMEDVIGIKGIWALRKVFHDPYDDFILQSFISDIKILSLNKKEDDEIEEVELPCFSPKHGNVKMTIHCQNMLGNMWLQITEDKIILIDSISYLILDSWSPVEGEKISLGSASPTQVAVALSKRKIIYFEVISKKIVEKSSKTFDHEVSCINISPLANRIHDEKVKNNQNEHWEASICLLKSFFCVVGFWTDSNVYILNLPDLDIAAKDCINDGMNEQEGTEFLPRSLLLASLDYEDTSDSKYLSCKAGEELSSIKSDYLLIGLGDGALIIYNIDKLNGQIFNKKKINIGVKPISISIFSSSTDAKHKNKTCVFVSCDRPTILYKKNNNKDILFASVNTVMTINHICFFNNKCLENENETTFIFSDDNSVTFGTIDKIQKLHIKSYFFPNVKENPRRIAHDKISRTICVLTTVVKSPNKTLIDSQKEIDDEEIGYVRIYDDETFDEVHEYTLQPNEIGQSLITTAFFPSSDSDAYFYVVGTAFIYDSEPEPVKGRILVFSVKKTQGSNKELNLVIEKETEGAVYCLSGINGKLLTGVNSKIHLYKWQEEATENDNNNFSNQNDKEIVLVCSHDAHTLALYLSVHNDFFIIGDLMQSMSLYQYFENDSKIKQIARDQQSQWMTAVTIPKDEEVLLANAYVFSGHVRLKLRCYYLFQPLKLSILGAESDNNLFTLTKNYDFSTYKNNNINSETGMNEINDEDNAENDFITLVNMGYFHLGDFINRFRHGSLVMKQASNSQCNSILFCTVSGSIGVLLSLNKSEYEFFSQLEIGMNNKIINFGHLSQKDWRSVMNKRCSRRQPNKIPSKFFIDGDYIESFLHLSHEEMVKVLDYINNNPTIDSNCGSDKDNEEDNRNKHIYTLEEVIYKIESMKQRH